MPGLYVLGQRFQHRRDSNFIDGVRHDAAYLTHHLGARLDHRLPAHDQPGGIRHEHRRHRPPRRTVSAGDIELFAALTGDRNPLHYDEAAAAATRFGGIVVQGGVTSGLLNAVVAHDVPGPGMVFLHTDWSYRAAVRPGDTITAEVEVLDVRRDKPIAKLRTAITDQRGVVVLDGTALVWTEPLPAACDESRPVLSSEGSSVR